MFAAGTVTTPAVPQKPTGYLWDALDKADSPAALDELEAHTITHGYSPDGQIRRAIAEKRAALIAATNVEG